MGNSIKLSFDFFAAPSGLWRVNKMKLFNGARSCAANKWMKLLGVGSLLVGYRLRCSTATSQEKRRAKQLSEWSWAEQKTSQPNHNSKSNQTSPALSLFDGLLCCGAEWIEWKWSLVLLSLGGLWACGQANGSAQKRKQQHQINEMEWSWRQRKELVWWNGMKAMKAN